MASGLRIMSPINTEKLEPLMAGGYQSLARDTVGVSRNDFDEAIYFVARTISKKYVTSSMAGSGNVFGLVLEQIHSNSCLARRTRQSE